MDKLTTVVIVVALFVGISVVWYYTEKRLVDTLNVPTYMSEIP